MNQLWRRYLLIAAGCLLSAIGINAFLVPHHLLSGGISGIAIILYFLFETPIGLMIILMNIPLFYAAYRMLNKQYVITALYGLLVFSAAIDATHFLAGMELVSNTILAAIYGGAVSGVGGGLVFRADGSAGGTDIVAAIVRKYYAFNVGLVSFSINFALMGISALLFGLELAMYTLLSMYVTANLVDKVIEGFNRKKTVMIISEHSDQIAAAIMQEVGRGVTFLQGQGAFTRNNKQILFVVVTLTQIAQIKFIVEKIDDKAFMIVQDAAEVLGKGFSA